MYRPLGHLVLTVATAVALAACATGGGDGGNSTNESANPDAVSATEPSVFAVQPLVVVHAQRRFDRSATAKLGIDRLVEAFQAKKRPVAFLTTNPSDSGWYTAERKPTVALTSVGGEHGIGLTANQATIVGGFFSTQESAFGCHLAAVKNMVLNYFEGTQRVGPLTIHMPLDAIYFYEEDGFLRKKLLDPTVPRDEVRQSLIDYTFFYRDTMDGITPTHFADPFPEGAVALDRYSFQMSIDGAPLGAPIGGGVRRVNLALWRSVSTYAAKVE